ncbi:hypothetical protein ACS0TY_031571 [Phlomoides rotata]
MSLEMSTAGDLLQIKPLQLQFPFELKKQISCSLQLSNKSDNCVAFKVKTTHPEKYCVRPNSGAVLPHSTCDVIITMQALKEAPADMQCGHKFLVQCVVVSPGSAAHDITDEMLSKESGNHVEEYKLSVSYVPPPQLPSLLQIQPLELQFPFELKKQVSCTLQLSNKSDNFVAFKVKTTHPKKYCVRPNIGVVLPHSICDVIITMQALKEAPADMQCRHKFLVQCVVVSPGSTTTTEMFREESGNHVEERRLRVSYVLPPQPPSPGREGMSDRRSKPRYQEFCPCLKNILLLDSEGMRVASKYYSDDWPTNTAKQAFEKTVFSKTHKTNAWAEAEIAMLENNIIVYKFVQDLHFYVTGGEDENEIILASVLEGFFDAVDILLRGNVDKREALQNLDLILLCINEIIDGGIILETDASTIASKVAGHSVDSGTPLSEQTISQALSTARQHLTSLF